MFSDWKMPQLNLTVFLFSFFNFISIKMPFYLYSLFNQPTNNKQSLLPKLAKKLSFLFCFVYVIYYQDYPTNN